MNNVSNNRVVILRTKVHIKHSENNYFFQEPKKYKTQPTKF